jgi:hypothetical protein
MIALAGSLRLRALAAAGAALPAAGGFDARPRWSLESLPPA